MCKYNRASRVKVISYLELLPIYRSLWIQNVRTTLKIILLDINELYISNL